MPFKNYYKILGVSSTADEQTIKRKFRELARLYHPDASRTGSRERFQEINEAYQVLSDKAKRSTFDRELRERNSVSRSGSTGSTSSAYVRQERPAPRPDQPLRSHRRPDVEEPVRGPVHSATPGAADAFAGVTLFAGVIACGLIAFVVFSLIDIVVGEGVTIREAPTLTVDERATVTAVSIERATDFARPTLPYREALAFSTQPLTDNDPLNLVLQGTFPVIRETCVIELGNDDLRCESEHIRSLSTGVVNSAVLNIEFDPHGESTALRRAIFMIQFTGDPRGITVNIGDSRKNAGTGQRASTGDPRYNAEIVIEDGDLKIYGFDATCTELSSTLLYFEEDIVSAGSTLYIEVQDQVIRWIDERTFEINRLESRCGFAIGGQSIQREQTDNLIYASFNRAIQSGTTSTGSGVANVHVILLAGSE